jgi:hypothetical protein
MTVVETRVLEQRIRAVVDYWDCLMEEPLTAEQTLAIRAFLTSGSTWMLTDGLQLAAMNTKVKRADKLTYAFGIAKNQMRQVGLRPPGDTEMPVTQQDPERRSTWRSFINWWKGVPA